MTDTAEGWVHVPETVEGTAVEGTAAEVTEEPGRELVATASREVLMPLDAGEVIAGMRAYQRLLKELLDPSDWQAQDGKGRALEHPFPKKSAWRKIARAFNLSTAIIATKVDRDEHGVALRAEATVRAIAPNGQFNEADGYCSREESRFGKESGRMKLENDLRATATTRAKNRAIADLVGMGEVSAEEVAIDPPAAQEASPDLRAVVQHALGYLLDGDVDAITAANDALSQQFDGRLPATAGQALVILATQIKRHHEETHDGAQ